MPTEQQSETKMTTVQLGKRVGDLEHDVKSLNKSVGELSVVTNGVQQNVNILTTGQQAQSEKLDRLLARNAGGEATKGMIPVSYVTWGVGAVLTMTGLFFTASIIVAGMILFAMESGDKQNDLVTDRVKDDVAEHDQFISRVREEGVFTHKDFRRFEDTEFHPLRDRIQYHDDHDHQQAAGNN
jgi:hypothetical protein